MNMLNRYGFLKIWIVLSSQKKYFFPYFQRLCTYIWNVFCKKKYFVLYPHGWSSITGVLITTILDFIDAQHIFVVMNFPKVHVFKDGHKNWQNHHRRFDIICNKCQIDGEVFVDFFVAFLENTNFTIIAQKVRSYWLLLKCNWTFDSFITVGSRKTSFSWMEVHHFAIISLASSAQSYRFQVF